MLYFLLLKAHRRTGLKISAQEPLGGSGGMLRREILKNRFSLMPFPAFWTGCLCRMQVTNGKKILRILVKQNLNKKIARLLSRNCPTN